MAEAKKRNPDILLYGLSWGVPGWIGNGNFFSQDNIDYHIKWLQGAKQVYGLGILTKQIPCVANTVDPSNISITLECGTKGAMILIGS